MKEIRFEGSGLNDLIRLTLETICDAKSGVFMTKFCIVEQMKD